VAKVKGTLIQSAVRFLRHHKDAARASLPPTLHHYLEERVLPTDWYPETDLVAMMRAMAPLLQDAGEDAFVLMGRAAVREHLDGVYEHLLKGARASLGRRLATLWQTQHDSGRVTTTELGPVKARFELADYGHPTREMCASMRGYVLEMLESAGFSAVEVREIACVLEGARHCGWEACWREPEPG
jgi:predicted hydrocarbon binding protein